MKKESRLLYIITLLSIVIMSSIATTYAQTNPNNQNIPNWNGSPILLYRDSFSPSDEVHILIYAPDFNSSPYLIDTIGTDPDNKITITTREASIPYKLVETGPDTGIFGGYVTLSGSTSTCSPVCGPTDGNLAASGDSGITVSFTISEGRTISNTFHASEPSGPINGQSIPEFGQLSGLAITISIITVIIFSRKVQN